MKPEPLNNKLAFRQLISNDEYGTIIFMPCFKKEDVASAVEWLKEKIDRSISPILDEIIKMDIKDWIDESFEDVVKEEIKNDTSK